MQPQALSAARPLESALAWLQLTALALALILAAGLLKIGAAPYIAFAFAGSFLIFLRSSPTRAELAASAAIVGAAFALVYRLHGGVFLGYFASELILSADDVKNADIKNAATCTFVGIG